jgi:hypothetical protein
MVELMMDLRDNARERGKQRSAERARLAEAVIEKRIEWQREMREAGDIADDLFMREGNGLTMRCVEEADRALEQMEYLRQELVQILIADRRHQTERGPDLTALNRMLGELAMLTSRVREKDDDKLRGVLLLQKDENR